MGPDPECQGYYVWRERQTASGSPLKLVKFSHPMMLVAVYLD